MHRHDRPRPRGDPRGDVLGVEVEGRGIDLGEHGSGATAGDRLGRGEEREGGADHLVAWADLHRVHHQHERIGAVRDTDRLRDAEIGGGLGLEGGDVRPEHEPPLVQHLGEGLLELGDQWCVLGLDVNERNLRHAWTW